MKIYISAGERFVTSPIDRLKSSLGLGWYTKAHLNTASLGKCNFVVTPDHYGDSIDDWVAKIKRIGGKYVTKRYGQVYFYYDMSKLNSDYKTELQQAKDDYTAELNAIDIDQYKPDNATIKKITDYRDRGSKVNVKAIKDPAKAIKYYYAACIVDWGELAGACRNLLCGLSSKFGYEASKKYEDILNAIGRRVESDNQYSDTRSDYEKDLKLPATNGLFTFEDKHCWVPKKILMYFVENNIPVHFGKRTSGAEWDRNGRQWSEVEHLTLFPDSEHPINYDLVVHTDEGGGANTYTGDGTDERTSIKNVIEDIDRKVRRLRG